MKTAFKKIASLLICLCLIISGMVITASAADTTEITFELGANGSASHNDGSEIKANQTYTEGDYSLTITNYSKCYSGARDAKGNSALKLGTSGAIGKFTIVVPDDVVSVIFNVAKYKAKTSKISINSGTTKTLSKSSDNGEYEAITVDTTSNKTINFTTVSTGYRCMINSIIYVVETTTGGDEGGNEGGEDPVDPPVEPDPEEPVVTPDPENGSTLTIAEALALGATKADGVYTTNKYYITGEITEVANTTYGNMTIKDADNNTIYIYGTKNADGTVRYDALDNKPDAGDVITVLSVVGNYGGTAQLNDAWITAHTDNNPVTPDPEEPGEGGGETPDPDEPAGNTATITFDKTDGKRTELSTTKQVWVENGITITNNKTSSSSNIADNCNPIRFYKNSIIIVAVSNGKIAQIVFDTNGSDYATAMKNSITSGGTATTASDKVTFVPTTSSESFEFTLSGGQVRMDSITVTYEAKAPVADMGNTSVDVKEDLSVNQEVTVKPEDIEGKELVMHFTMNGVTTTVPCNPSQIVDNKVSFTFDNIGIQCMADEITAKLVTVENDKETEQATATFSVKAYAKAVLETSTDEATKKFVSDMLRYGAAAQVYQNYTASGLATDGLESLLVEGSSTEVPTEEKMSLTDNASAGDVYFKGATVRFDNTNTLVIKLNAVTENTKVLVNGAEATLNGLECVITGLKATDYATKFTFELYEGDLLVQTLSYGINSYAFSKQTSTNDSMAALAKALYAYGASASTPAN